MLVRPDKSEIADRKFPCADEASSASTSSTDVFPVPFAPIITDSGFNSSRTSRNRRNP
jgi:hypothetical protein